MGFQPTQRTKREPAKILLQFSNIVPAQPYIMNKISRTLQVGRTDVVEFRANTEAVR